MIQEKRIERQLYQAKTVNYRVISEDNGDLENDDVIQFGYRCTGMTESTKLIVERNMANIRERLSRGATEILAKLDKEWSEHIREV